MDSLRIVRRFQAKGLFKLSEETLDECATLLGDLKKTLREPDHSVEEKKKALKGPLATLSGKLHHVFVRVKRFDLDFTPQQGEPIAYEDLGTKLHDAEAALQRLANFVLHPEKHLQENEDVRLHAEAAWTLAHEAFRDVHAALVAARWLHDGRKNIGPSK